MEQRKDTDQRECFDNAVNKKIEPAILMLTAEEKDKSVDDYRIKISRKYKGRFN